MFQEISSDQQQPIDDKERADALMRYAVERSPTIFYVVEADEDYRLSYISPNVETITGHPPHAFLRDRDYARDYLHPDDLPAYLETVESMKTNGFGFHEYRFRTLSGEYRWFRDDLKMTISAKGARCIVGCMIEITERKVAEMEREQVSGLLDDSLESLPNGFAIFDENDHLIRCNSSYASLYESEPEDLIGLHGDELFERAERFSEIITDREGNECTLEWARDLDALRDASDSNPFQMRVKDGRWFLITARRTPIGTTVVLRTDITVQKRCESSFRDAKALKAGIIDSTMDCIIAMDEEGRIIEFNKAAEQTFGHSREQAIGRAIGDLIIAEQDRGLKDGSLFEIPRNGPKSLIGRRSEIKAMRADGSRFPAELTVSEVPLAEHRVFTVGLRDITEQKRARKERKRLIQLLRDAIESVPNGFTIFDSSENLVLCNTAYASFYDMTPDAMVGMTRRELRTLALDGVELIDGRSADEIDMKEIHEVMRCVEGRPIEVKLKDGRWILISVTPTSEGGAVLTWTDITALKEAEAKLRQREQHFRRIVEAQPVPVLMADFETGEILYESPASAEMFQRSWPSENEFNIRDCYVDPADRDTLLEALLHREGLDDYEVRVKKLDGTKFWISTTSRLLDLDGRKVVISSIVDMNERIKREAEMRQARETLEDAIESLSEGFALYDADDCLVMCNQRYRDFNWQTADLIKPGMYWGDFIRACADRGQYVESKGQEEAWIEKRKTLRASHTPRVEVHQSDDRWFEISYCATRAGGIVVTRTEVTQRKKMDKALRDSEALVRMVLEAQPVPVAMARAKDGVILYESPASKALACREQASPQVESMLDSYVDPADRDRFLRLLQTHGRVDDFETQLKKANGTDFWAAMSARLIDYQGEEVIVSSTLDLTERRALERDMARRREAMHQSEKMAALGCLLAGVAHELNNPLSVVVGQALLLRETAMDQKIVDRAAKIGTAADRCSRIVRAFLAMARQRPPQRSEVQLNELTESVIEMVSYSLRTANIDVNTSLPRDLPSVWGDTDQLNQVLVNLILNAQQALAEGAQSPAIEISTGYDARRDEVRITVRDNGPGIPDRIRSRIFEPFFTTKETGEGTGIGLSVSFGIVESHGGRIEVGGREGEGASFSVVLPRFRAVRDNVPEAQAPETPTPPCEVLIVDDESEIAQTLHEILSVDGHQIEIATSGREALAKIAERSYDVILCDLRMPDIDGRGLYQDLSRRQPELVDKMAFVTGDVFGNKANEFLNEAGLPYIEKPFTPEEVRSLVEQIVARMETHG